MLAESQMLIAILDPAAGISGDMTLGALVDAGAPQDWLEQLPRRLGFPEVEVRIETVRRASLAATRVLFDIPGHGAGEHGRSVGELIGLVEAAPVSEWVRTRAVRAFTLLGEAEGRVHGCAPADVHLHEVGAVDAVLDIVGSIEGFERLGVDAVYNLPVAIGTGWANAAHGKLPVPAPATAILLEGIELAGRSPVEGEATTPTGAALLRVLSRGAPPERWRITRSGWGAGQRDPSRYPNALRLLIAEAAHEAGMIEVIATDVDDLNPEYLEPLRRAVLDAGALDCVAWPTHGKKGRISMRIEALAPVDRADSVVEAMFRHSTTAGVRHGTFLRETLQRRQLVVELDPDTRVRIKVWEAPGGRRLKAEFDDVDAAATKLGRPALEIAREAERRAESLLGGEDRERDDLER